MVQNEGTRSKPTSVSSSVIAADVTDIKTYIASEGIQLKPSYSSTGNVEEDQYAFFAIYLNDVVVGTILLADIDITAISAILYISTGGAAFTSVGITQPVFTKANGVVSVNYKFLAAQWELGDSYKLVVSGIEVTIGTDTMPVPGKSWVASVTEQVNVEAKIDTIDGVVDIVLVDTGTTLPAEHTTIVTDLSGVREKKVRASAISARIASLAFTNGAGDKDFANVVFPGTFIPATATIIAAHLWIKYGSRKDSSGVNNKINAAAKTIRAKLAGGAWGVDDIVAMTMVLNGWDTDGNARGEGDLMIGSVDLSSILDTPGNINGATVNVRSEETNAGEGITVTAASLTFYDIDSYIEIEYRL